LFSGSCGESYFRKTIPGVCRNKSGMGSSHQAPIWTPNYLIWPEFWPGNKAATSV
jgi:hypothetical protein